MTAALFIAIGVLGLLWILYDIFAAVLLPRAVDSTNRISVFVARALWTTWRRIALTMRVSSRREDFLGSYAPFAFVLLLFAWVLGLIVAYALILFGLRDEIKPGPADFGTVLYFSASSVLTIGYGDVVAAEGPARIVALCAGASGIGTVAIAIAFLYALVGSFQQRERFVVILDARAGAPPSGLALLETYAKLDLLSDLTQLFRESEYWVADVLDSHLAYPLLMFFRSSHKDESWVAALGALLDAAAILVTVVENVPTGAARLFLDVAMHLTHDLAAFYILPGVRAPAATVEERSALCARLVAAGFQIRTDGAVWEEFHKLRAQYLEPLEGIGHRWLIATALLVGQRTTLPGHDA